MLGMALGAPQDDPQDMYFNHLNISPRHQLQIQWFIVSQH